MESIDWQNMCRMAIQGLNKKEARRVAKALDVAIAFGATQYADGNESLRDIESVRALMFRKYDELRGL